MKIQASPWTAQEITAETTQSTIQKQTLWQQEVMRLIQMAPKTQNWIYSGLENKQTTIFMIYTIFLIFVCWKCMHTEKICPNHMNKPVWTNITYNCSTLPQLLSSTQLSTEHPTVVIQQNDNHHKTPVNRVTDLHFWLAVVREIIFVELPRHHDVGTALGHSTSSSYSRVTKWLNLTRGTKCISIVGGFVACFWFRAPQVLNFFFFFLLPKYT